MKKRNYYILSDGHLKRHENTIYFENKDGKRPIPINTIYAIYSFGSLTVTTQSLSLLAKEGVSVHFFNRHGFYTGSFYPRETLISGDMTVKQVQHHLEDKERMYIAKAFVEGSVRNMEKVLSYYDIDFNTDEFLGMLYDAGNIPEVMGVEASARTEYYSHFDGILKHFKFERRTRMPPENEVNAMISFGNSLLYSTVLSEIYNTQLNPTISFLHEPAERRFSLALDIAEIFKPLLVDRTIFHLVNKRIINEDDFTGELNGVLLSDSGRRKFISAYNEKLNTTIKHRSLMRNVSYQRLIRLECYKLVKHFLGVTKYRPFVIWW